MSGASGGETRAYVSTRGLAQLRTQLTDRDVAIVRQVAELRLMSAAQLQAVHFPTAAHGNQAAATRARQRVLARLVRDRLLVSLTRRIGGVRAGSAGLVLALGPVGHRLLRLSGARPHRYEPTERFVDHTLAVAELLVGLIVANRAGGLELLDYECEPASWRHLSGLERGTLRPDLNVVVGADGYELRWFVEVDRGTESLPVVLQKCRRYSSYYQAGVEQARTGSVFPRVCWVVLDQARADRIAQAIQRDQQLPAGLFVVAVEARAINQLCEVPRAD
jgi:Replication-relaxation